MRNADAMQKAINAFVKRKNAKMENTLVVMRLKTWEEWYAEERRGQTGVLDAE